MEKACVLRHYKTILAILMLTHVIALAQQQTIVTRTKAEVEALIAKQGSIPPEWWDSVELRYPQSLDLNWPIRPPEPWNANRNVGQYIWDVINPNPSRWKEGIKLVNHLMIRNKDDRSKVLRSMDTLGRMFHDLLEDWARAAFWWRKSAEMGGWVDPVKLAHCYWKLGSREMTVEILSRLGGYSRNGSDIRLWAEIGEIDKALQLAESTARFGAPDIAYLAAGDVCRKAGQYEKAIAYYQKVISVSERRGKQNPNERDQVKERAQTNLQATKLFDTLDIKKIPDGSYKGHSPAYAGELHVEVTVKSGRIDSIRVTDHKERQFYSAITDTISQMLSKQSVRGIDATTGATMTADAIVNATARALVSGMK